MAMNKQVIAATVDEYIEALPSPAKDTLQKVRKAIKAAAPGAEELISYQIPMYKLNGHVAAIAAFKNHCSYFTTSHAVMRKYKEELKPYHTAGVTIHFPLDKPLPATLVKKLVAEKIMENKARLAAKKTGNATKKPQ